MFNALKSINAARLQTTFSNFSVNANPRIIKISLRFVPYGSIDAKSSLVQVMSWHCISEKHYIKNWLINTVLWCIYTSPCLKMLCVRFQNNTFSIISWWSNEASAKICRVAYVISNALGPGYNMAVQTLAKGFRSANVWLLYWSDG